MCKYVYINMFDLPIYARIDLIHLSLSNGLLRTIYLILPFMIHSIYIYVYLILQVDKSYLIDQLPLLLLFQVA